MTYIELTPSLHAMISPRFYSLRLPSNLAQA